MRLWPTLKTSGSRTVSEHYFCKVKTGELLLCDTRYIDAVIQRLDMRVVHPSSTMNAIGGPHGNIQPDTLVNRLGDDHAPDGAARGAHLAHPAARGLQRTPGPY